MSQEILYFMSVGASQDDSFEEIRIQDYVSSYQRSGRPPQPIPQSPDTPNARAALRLPPLFVPTAIPVPADPLSPAVSAAPASTPADLPSTHEFRPNKPKLNAESFESISAQSLYTHFAHEELRYYAYLAGHKLPPAPSPTDAMGSDVSTFPVHPFYASDARSTAYMTASPVTGGTPDYLMSIVASHRFDKHSFEELRIACLLAGKEVGSSEIPTRGALPAQTAPTLFARPRGDAFSSGSLKLL